MTRLKRDAEEREAAALEAAELMRRRNMTDEERLEEDRKLGRILGTKYSHRPKPFYSDLIICRCQI